MATKHDILVQYIAGLSTGTKISVRSLAKQMDVSEGTAYRAIKETESQGLVTTIPRVGTVRVEKTDTDEIDFLTYETVIQVVDGKLLGGKGGLRKPLDKFVIAAMQEKDILRYLEPGNLMIVGNREEAQQLALENQAGVLITGGFNASKEVTNLADNLDIPVISTSFDTFTVATMINKALTDQRIKKDILLVDNIAISLDETLVLFDNDSVDDFRDLADESEHTRYPVVNHQNRLLGIVTAKDIIGFSNDTKIGEVMTLDPVVAKPYMTVASVTHLMIWDRLEMMPVVSDDFFLQGIITRSDVMKALQYTVRQPQIGTKIDDIIQANLTVKYDLNDPRKIDEFTLRIDPQMTNSLGSLSNGVIDSAFFQTTETIIQHQDKKSMVVDSMSIFYFAMIRIDHEAIIRHDFIEKTRTQNKVEVSMYQDGQLVTRAILTCHILDK